MRSQDKRHRKIRKCTAGPNFSGQHLLHNPKTIQQLVHAPNIQPHETVLDIGAGKGALTFPLAGKAGKVIAVEQDAQYVELLREKAGLYPQLAVVHGDFRTMRLPAHPFCVVANIPFSITTSILEKLLGPEGKEFQRGALLMEQGAARRFTAPFPTDPRLLAWRMNFHMEIRMTVPRAHFAPPPRVDAAIVSIVRKENPLLPAGQYARFYAFAALGLRNARCPLHETFGTVFTAAQLKKVLKDAQADRNQSAAALSVRQWDILFQAMLRHVQPYRWPK